MRTLANISFCPSITKETLLELISLYSPASFLNLKTIDLIPSDHFSPNSLIFVIPGALTKCCIGLLVNILFELV